jgi:hypothetical protein
MLVRGSGAVWGRATIRRRERSRDVRRTNLRISVAGSAVSLPLSLKSTVSRSKSDGFSYARREWVVLRTAGGWRPSAGRRRCECEGGELSGRGSLRRVEYFAVVILVDGIAFLDPPAD